MEYVASIQTDLNGYPRSEKLILKQGDTGMRYVVVTLLSDGVPVSVGTDVTISVAMTKPDGTQVVAEDNIERLADGKLKIKIIPQMTIVAGAGTMDIALYKGAEQISTATFDVLIYPSAMSMPAIASSSEYQALLSALAQIGAAVDAEETRKYNESRREENEGIRNQNEVSRSEAFRQQSSDMWSTVNSAVASANEVTNTVQQKLDNGELVGPQGPQGDNTGIGIYWSDFPSVESTTVIYIGAITVPAGFFLKTGDMVIAQEHLFQVTGIQGTSVNVRFLQKLVGPQGPQGLQGLQGPRGPAGPQGPQGDLDGIRSAGIYYSNAVANAGTTTIEYSTVQNWFPSGCQFYNGDLIISNGSLFQVTGQGSSGLSVRYLCTM